MKKIISILLVSAISLSIFTSCGEKSAFADVTTDVAEYTYSTEEKISPEEDTTEATLEEEEPETEEESGIYDNTAIVEAYKSGDTSALSQDDLLVYQAAVDAISVFYSDGMSDDEIILAAHDYITTNITYDSDELSLIGTAKAESSTPYGALIYGEAICMGYTTTFQLFMDMLGVESVIVTGSSAGEDHAWNMVCVDDKWYHVDCTWDDYVPDYEGRRPFHTYFMVTDGVMALEHVWDMGSTPTADSEDYVYYFTHDLYFDSKDDLRAALKSENSNGELRAEVAIPLDEDVLVPYFSSGAIYAYWRIDLDTYSVVIYYFEEQ
ncbi:MAG: transglutaminase [Oscillospiraceae bacterium]|nr:transglutaminase [Oscillospiraceae bacterium]